MLRLSTRPGHPRALAMVRRTLDAMAAGGIRDHLAGGFHRYSTDPHWLVPHFEKMLYDQALLALAYTEAFQATGHEPYRDVARETLEYVLRLRQPSGGLASAEDADSEGVEGRYYVWKADEIRALLGARAPAFLSAYGVTERGHMEGGWNVLHLESTPLPAECEILLRARQGRVAPSLDDKVLTDWNALAAAALAKAGAALPEPRFTAAAQEVAAFLLSHHRQADGFLLHRSRGKHKDATAFLDDYAYLMWACLELYQGTFEVAWLSAAVELAGRLEGLFAAPGGGLYVAPASPDLLVRRRNAYDGALPSGQGVATWCLVRLSRLTGDPRWEELATTALETIGPDIKRHPTGFAASLMALDWLAGPAQEIVLSTGPGRPALEAALAARYRPRDVVLRAGPQLVALAPWTKPYGPVGGKAAAYVCTNHACRKPETDPGRL
ncbi:MAG: thioredoxin domain-containing protein [Thermoplasmatota archaeon]